MVEPGQEPGGGAGEQGHRVPLKAAHPLHLQKDQPFYPLEGFQENSFLKHLFYHSLFVGITFSL